MTRISAIITTYNVEAYIATAMQSVIDAGFDDLELIVVDDGSTDGTRHAADIIGRMAPRDRVTYVPEFFANNTVGGVACAANAGLDRATGEIVIFVDGDDWVYPHTLRQAVDRLHTTQADFVVCGCQEYWNNTGRITNYEEWRHWDTAERAADLETRRDALLQMAPFPWRKIYRRDFLNRKDIRFPIGDYFFEDNPFHWETTVRADRFSFFRPVTHVHRMARQGQTVTRMGRRPLQIFEHARTIRRMLVAQNLMQRHEERYFNWLTDHVLWCCRHVSPEGLNLLFDAAGQAIRPLSDASYWEILSHKSRSMSEVQQLTALRLGDRLGFLNAIGAERLAAETVAAATKRSKTKSDD